MSSPPLGEQVRYGSGVPFLRLLDPDDVLGPHVGSDRGTRPECHREVRPHPPLCVAVDGVEVPDGRGPEGRRSRRHYPR